MGKARVIALMSLLSIVAAAAGAQAPPSFPWREAGLTERQAAAHLLDRFAFGPRPGDLEGALETGLEAWFEEQLHGQLPDEETLDRLRPFDAFGMSDVEIAQTFLRPAALVAVATRQGELDPSQLERAAREDSGMSPGQRRSVQRRFRSWAQEEGYRPQRELMAQLYSQKILRAAYSSNQLQEVMTDFWFNHFNVSLTDGQSRGYLFSYERDAIRPHVLGTFRELLGATASHPAMLTYLDNARSSAEEGMPTTFESPQRKSGLNENFARELLELHTLGVDGGYDQADVIEVARGFTGWTVVPGNRLDRVERRLRGAHRSSGPGFYLEGLFLFRADLHDAGEKSVLGHPLPAGRGIEDGREILDLLAAHPSTARHLATKIAVRFVSDDPPAALVDRLAQAFTASGGDIEHVLRALAYSPELWAPETLRQKVKSPFEVAISAIRALDGEIARPRRLAEWIARMGQRLYAYQAPTGFPDRAEAWVNTGSLLNRMNFGLQLATGGVEGVSFDLVALVGGVEPESVDRALATYLSLLLPERPAEPVLRQLEPVVRAPELAQRVAEASPEAAGLDPVEAQTGEMELGDGFEDGDGEEDGGGDEREGADAPPRHSSEMLAQVVGVILGSPEFQRR